MLRKILNYLRSKQIIIYPNFLFRDRIYKFEEISTLISQMERTSLTLEKAGIIKYDFENKQFIINFEKLEGK